MTQQERQLYIFRHGETDWNIEGRLQGHKESKLNKNGIYQAEILAKRLKDINLEILFSSDLLRAKETSLIISKFLKIDVIYHTGLREIYSGEAQGILESDLIHKFGKETYLKWKEDDNESGSFRFPGGESKKEASDRISQTVKDLVRIYNKTKIGICTHGFVMKQFCEKFSGKTMHERKIENCEIRRLIYLEQEERILNV
ncbi:histidine phosphatase family protein [Leptospira semungkisensis]|uniref:Histidine phosphatase family protein n=1 Tax=Leptospira semungkisensis TaxID=2484985 RepID=A0A4R9FLE8_9LEPT|nr:histidine phosphatase family protein [Leptospira semungkisensis]TGJ99485.1 histidine phosphatase family protein [Leptospira semungkisensis]